MTHSPQDDIVTQTDLKQPSPPGYPQPGMAVLSILVVLACSMLDWIIPPLGIPITLGVIAVWMRWRREPWSHLGLRRPQQWWPLWVGALVGAVALQAACTFVVIPALHRFGVPMPNYSAFATLEGNFAMFAVLLIVSWTTAGFGEEVIWRGFLMTRILSIFGDGPLGRVAALVVSSVGFGLMHFYQGITGVFLTGFTGLVFGLVFLFSGRRLWGVVFLHAWTDTVAMVLFYTGAWRHVIPGT